MGVTGRGNNAPVDEYFPVLDYFVHSRSLAGVRRPAFLDELPHLGSKTKPFSGQQFCRPFPVDDLHDDRTIRHIGERNPPSEHLHNEHRERKNVGRF